MYRLLFVFILVSSSLNMSRVGAQACVPTAEVCDGMDNDCDQAVDNPPFADAPPPGQTGCWDLPGNCCSFANLNWCPPPGATCGNAGSLSSPCTGGTITCDAGAWKCANVVRPVAEVCDGVDNDCDAIADNGTQAGTSCSSGVGACAATGVLMCTMTGAACTAQPGPPSTELCGNGVDDDCNGMVDEGFTLGASCTVGVGACATTGASLCSGGSESCDAVAGEPAADELCGNGIDDDCDGFTDDGFVLDEPCTVGIGGCAATGVTICDGAGTTCDAVEGTPAASETCGDGVDDDCNGAVDDGCTSDAGVTDDAGIANDASVTADASVPVDSGVDASVPAGGDSSGCSCRVGASGSPVGSQVMALGLIAIVLARRARRARTDS